jgi:hypothetical protein
VEQQGGGKAAARSTRGGWSPSAPKPAAPSAAPPSSRRFTGAKLKDRRGTLNERAGGSKGSTPWLQGAAAGCSVEAAAALGRREWLPRLPAWPEGLGWSIDWEPGPEAKRRKWREEAAAEEAR